MKEKRYMYKKEFLRIVQTALGLALGGVFILSSLSKAVNIFSIGQTTDDFLGLLGMDSLYGFGMFFAGAFCVIELFLGILAMRKEFRPIAVLGMFALLLFFTYITYINYTDLYGGIESCGCFGEIIHFTAPQTFYKNVILFLIVCCLIPVSLREISVKSGIRSMIARNRKYLGTTLGITILMPLYSYAMMNVLPPYTYLVIYVCLSLCVILYATPIPRYILYKYSCLLCLIILAGCSPDRGVEQTITRQHVLAHYRFVDRDTLKYQAAEFLLDNMKYHTSREEIVTVPAELEDYRYKVDSSYYALVKGASMDNMPWDSIKSLKEKWHAYIKEHRENIGADASNNLI